jgi:hypothetical protein
MPRPDRLPPRARPLARGAARAIAAALAAGAVAPGPLAAQPGASPAAAAPPPGAAGAVGARTASPSARTAPPNTLTAAERAAGGGCSSTAPRSGGGAGSGATPCPTAHWTVEDGAIKKIASGQVPVQADGQPVGGGDLMTEATFGDFELTWEWRVSPGGNSGVKYNVSEALSTSVAPPHAAKGFEYQMIDDDRHPDGQARHAQDRPTCTTSIAADDRKRVRPAGEWNRSRLVFRGPHGEHWLNGAKVVEYELGTPRMRAALAASKYRAGRGSASAGAGHLVLQDHNDAVWFRDLKLRELDAGARARARR